MINTTIQKYAPVLVRISLGTIKYVHGKKKKKKIDFKLCTIFMYIILPVQNIHSVVYSETEMGIGLRIAFTVY